MATSRLSSPQRFILGLLFSGFGLVLILATFGVGPFGLGEIPGPAWLGSAAGGVFMALGIALMLGDISNAASAVAGLLIVVGLAAIANWTAFGAGARVCSGSGCLSAFAYGALVMDAFLLAVIARLAQKIAGGPPKLNRLMRASKGVLMVVLSPLLLLLFLWTAGRAMVKRARGNGTNQGTR